MPKLSKKLRFVSHGDTLRRRAGRRSCNVPWAAHKEVRLLRNLWDSTIFRIPQGLSKAYVLQNQWKHIGWAGNSCSLWDGHPDFFSNQMTGGTTRSVQHWGTGIWRFPSFLCGSINTSKYLNVKMMLITWKWFNPFSTWDSVRHPENWG